MSGPERDALADVIAAHRGCHPNDVARAVIAAGWRPPTEPTAERAGEVTVTDVFEARMNDYLAERAGDADDVAAVTVETRQRLIASAERPLKVRRAVLLLAAHASGHMKHPHGESCETCREKYPCITVLRAASPALRAFEECDVSIADADDLRRVLDHLASQPAAAPDHDDDHYGATP